MKLIAFAVLALGAWATPATAQTFSNDGPLADYADIALPEATVGRDYAWGLKITCPEKTEAISVACWIGTLSDATLTTNGGFGRNAYCLWRFGPFATGTGRIGRIVAQCRASSSIIRQRP